MNPPPPEHDLPSTAPDWEIWRPRLRVPLWLRDNPGLVLSTLYLALSVVGLFYQFLFFRRFQLNVLEFSDATDFLMVVVREPLTVAMASLGLAFYWAYMRATLGIMAQVFRRWPRLRGSDEKLAKSREKARRIAPSMQAAFIITYAALFTMLYSSWQAKRARSGGFPSVTVEFKVGAREGATPAEVTLLGTTARFVFLYYPETKRAAAVPLDAIATLSWDARRLRERQADEASATSAVAKPEAVTPTGEPAPERVVPAFAPVSPAPSAPVPAPAGKP
ncbi:MAG: hypothetical protein KBC32_01445 [Candidatus Didemnitutus sp.]|nr:hypothetical protein [Candidatus Didemnitutus sp.]